MESVNLTAYYAPDTVRGLAKLLGLYLLDNTASENSTDGESMPEFTFHTDPECKTDPVLHLQYIGLDWEEFLEDEEPKFSIIVYNPEKIPVR